MPEVKKSYIVGEKFFIFFRTRFFLSGELEKKAGQNYLSI